MAKRTKGNPTGKGPTNNATPAPAQPAIAYSIGKVPGLKASTAQGNVATWQLLAAALAKAPQTVTQLRTIAATRNHTSFVHYAIKNKWLVPSA